MFKYFLISIAIVPPLLGVVAAGRDGARGRLALSVSWVLYAVVWFGVLYYLRFRWT